MNGRGKDRKRVVTVPFQLHVFGPVPFQFFRSIFHVVRSLQRIVARLCVQCVQCVEISWNVNPRHDPLRKMTWRAVLKASQQQKGKLVHVHRTCVYSVVCMAAVALTVHVCLCVFVLCYACARTIGKLSLYVRACLASTHRNSFGIGSHDSKLLHAWMLSVGLWVPV